MTVTTKEGPPAGPAVLGQALRHLMTRRGDLLSAKGGAVDTSKPLEVFTLKLDDIAGPDFLQKAASTGWRYLIVAGGPIAMADLRGAAAEFANVTGGRLAEQLEQAARLAESAYGASATKFEARVLEIPSLYVMALWLHAGSGDRFIWIADGARADPAIVAEDPGFLDRILARANSRRSNAVGVP
jgi:hypothetical protein